MTSENQIKNTIERNEWNYKHENKVNNLLSEHSVRRRIYLNKEDFDGFDLSEKEERRKAIDMQEELACKIFEDWVNKHHGFDMAAAFFGGAYMDKNSEGWKSAEALTRMLASHNITTASGGGPGAMEVIRISQQLGLEGISIMQEGLDSEQKSKQIHDVDIKISLSLLRRRQGLLVDISSANIIVEGGKGTDYERDEIATLLKTGLCEDQKKTFLLDGAGKNEHWHHIHNHNLMLIEKGYLRFSSKKSMDLFGVVVGDKYMGFLKNYIDDLHGANLSPENIRQIASNCGIDALTLHNILIDSLYLRFKHGQEYKIVEAIIQDRNDKLAKAEVEKNMFQEINSGIQKMRANSN